MTVAAVGEIVAAPTTHERVWGHGGATDSGGTPESDDPFLIDLSHFGTDQAVWLSGAAGNYLSVPDTNLLDADAAHFQQGIGGWAPSAGTATNVQRVTTDPEFGDGHLSWESANGSTVEVASSPTVDAPAATAGAQYSVSARLQSITAPRNCRAKIQWIDASNTIISTTSGVVVLAVGAAWTTVTMTAQAPTGTVKARVVLSVLGTDAGDVFWADKVCLREGATTDFVPSTRVTADLTLVADVAAKSWASGGAMLLINKWSTNDNQRSYQLRLDSGGSLVLLISTDGQNAVSETSTVLIDTVVADRERLRFAAEQDASTGDVSFWYSTDAGATWAQLGTTVPGSGAVTLFSSSAEVAFGAQSQGFSGRSLGAAFYGAIHDGRLISDSAVTVASVDASSSGPLAPGIDSGLTPEGHTITLNRSGDVTAEIIDRSCLASTGAEFLELPDRDVLDAQDPMEFHWLAHVRTPSSHRNLYDDKNGTSLDAGLNAQLRSDGRWLVAVADGSALRTPVAAHDLSGEWGLLGGALDDDTLTALVDAAPVASLSTAALGDIANSRAKRVGAKTLVAPGPAISNTRPVMVEVWFTRVLTASERADLAAWDGTVASEPSWLRDSAKLYINADDPEWAKAYRDNDEVLNLAIPKFATVTAVGAIP